MCRSNEDKRKKITSTVEAKYGEVCLNFNCNFKLPKFNSLN